MSSDRFLVIGGLGFLGFHIIEDLIKLGRSVAAFDIAMPKDPEIIELVKKHNVKIYIGDLCKKEDIISAIKDFDVSVIINTASPPPLSKNFELFKRVNVDGAQNVMDCCIATGVKKYILTSSVGVTEDESNIEFGTETTTKYITDDNTNAYYRSKMMQEKLVLSYNGKGGLMTVALRPHRIFGPRDVTLVPRLIEAAEMGRNKFYLGDGKNVVDWTFVKNVSHAHILAAEKMTSPSSAPAGNFYFITNDEPIVFWEFVGTIWEALGYSRPWIGIPVWLLIIISYIVGFVCWVLRLFGKQAFPPAEYDLGNINLIVRNRHYNIAKAKKDLGYKPLTNMKESYALTVEYYKPYAQKKTK